MYARVTFQHVEIRKVTEMTQKHHRNVHFPLLCLQRFCGKGKGIFFLDIYILIIRNNPYHRYAAKLFQHLNTGFEKTYVSPELIDKNTFDVLAFFGRKQHYRTIHTGKDSATINIRHQNNIGSGVHCHREVHEIDLPQIDFGNTSRTLQYNGIIFFRKTVIGRAHFPAQFLSSFLMKIAVRTAVADRTTIQDHLRGTVRLRFQQ